MKIEASGRLVDDAGNAVPMQRSPNQGGKLVKPLGIVIHYTGGHGLQQSADWLCSVKAKASAHVVVGRERGAIIQLVSFNSIAWHAGPSSYGDRARCNEWMFGIEIDNPGKLVWTAAGWRTWYGAPVADADVVIDDRGAGWHAYHEDAILAAYGVCEAIIDYAPHVQFIVGHSDIAPGRKVDPGPAFPMETFRSWLLGRGEG
jgi:N-acetylmuramoyl-L-alanine amidase